MTDEPTSGVEAWTGPTNSTCKACGKRFYGHGQKICDPCEAAGVVVGPAALATPTASPATGEIERDPDDHSREYIPLPGGWEVQTKGAVHRSGDRGIAQDEDCARRSPRPRLRVPRLCPTGSAGQRAGMARERGQGAVQVGPQ